MRDPEGQALRGVVQKEIIRALDDMPEEFRMVVLLADVEELSYREIADILGVGAGSVGTLLARAEAEFERRFTP